MEFAGRYGLPGVAMILSGERKVFTASPLHLESCEHFQHCFPPCLNASRSLDTGLFGTMAHSVDPPLPVSIPYLFYNINDLLDKGQGCCKVVFLLKRLV